MIKRKTAFVFTFLLICFLVVPHVSTTKAKNDTDFFVTTHSLCDPSSPLTIQLAMSTVPKLNELTTVTCTVKSVGYDSPGATASIKLPQGAVLVSGNLDWHQCLPLYLPF